MFQVKKKKNKREGEVKRSASDHAEKERQGLEKGSNVVSDKESNKCKGAPKGLKKGTRGKGTERHTQQQQGGKLGKREESGGFRCNWREKMR